jgi:hypothetical protein
MPIRRIPATTNINISVTCDIATGVPAWKAIILKGAKNKRLPY